MNKKSLVKVLALILVIINLLPSLSYGDTTADRVNMANTLLGQINKFDINEDLKGLGELQEDPVEGAFIDIPLELHTKTAKYLYHITKLEEFIESNGNSLSDDIKEAGKSHRTRVDNALVTLDRVGATQTTLLEGVISESKTKISDIVGALANDYNGINKYRNNFEIIKKSIALWSDAIRFLHDEAGVTGDTYDGLVSDFESMYEIIVAINEEMKLDLNLGFINPEHRYSKEMTVSQNIMDSDGSFKSWYLEVFALSSLTDVTPLEEYKNKLTIPSLEYYNEYSKYRVPLYSGNDKDPIKVLNKGLDKNIVRSNLRTFLQNTEVEQVLYIPIYSNNDEINQGEDSQDVMKAGERLTYIPVYVKGTKMGMMSMEVYKDVKSPGNGLSGVQYKSALLNYLQLTNLMQSGKTNDMQLDLSYPLYMDMWGNIETYSGKVLIPSVGNSGLFINEEYFPLNAHFINNYPIETAMMKGQEQVSLDDSDTISKAISGVAALMKPNPKKLAVRKWNPGGKDTHDNTVEGIEAQWQDPLDFVNLKKNGNFSSSFKVGFWDRGSGSNRLPQFVGYIPAMRDGEEIKVPFLKIIPYDKSYSIIGLQETELILDNKKIPFLMVTENIPVEKWNYQYLAGSTGDAGKLNRTLLLQIAESCRNNPETNDNVMKTSDSQKITYGFKVGAMLEPLHKKMSEATKNYILYTPSIAELPGVESYLSVILMPVLKIALLIALVFTILQYVRYVKTMSLTSLALSIAILIGVNFGITNLYPAILNTGFNGVVSKALGPGSYYLTLYNIEKDLNSKGEFVYGDEIYDEKLVTEGAFIKIADLNAEEVKMYRAAQENAPYKDSNYYMPEWDTSYAYIGGDSSVFIRGSSLYIHIKDLTSSIIMTYDSVKGLIPVWDKLPAHSYYTPYNSILEGLTKSISKYTAGRMSPKTLTYSNGYQAYTGMSLSYFTSKYFIVDNESAKSNEEFMNVWELYNGGDFLNLKNVLYMEEDLEKFPSSHEFRVKDSRWYRTAMLRYMNKSGGYDEKELDIINNKILDVNSKTKSLIYDLLPYMDNISDDLILKIISLKATVEFNKEFSQSLAENVVNNTAPYLRSLITKDGETDFFTKIYPQRLELDTISIDEQLKLSLINVQDLLKFNVTSIYKFVENEASWLGMIMLGLVATLLYIRSLLRILLITVTVVIILMYMVIVYALRKNYSNKTIVSLFGIIGMSWGVYLIDNLLSLAFMHFDKRGAGALIMILLIWLIWNIVATVVYVLIFDMILKDVSAFGGNLMYGAASTVLNKTNNVVKSALGMVSKTRAENFDMTRPDFEMKAKDLEDYLSMDYNEKLINRQEVLGQAVTNVGIGVKDAVSSRLPKAMTIKEMYAQHKEMGHSNMDITTNSPLITKGVRDYINSYGVDVIQNPVNGQYTFRGGMEKWENLVQSNMINDTGFELFKEKDGEMFFPDSNLVRNLMNKSGAKFEKVGGNTLAVGATSGANIESMELAIKSPIYRIEGNIKEALNKVEGVLSPKDYEIGNNALYLNDRKKAEEIFGSDRVSTTHKTQHKIVDYSDRVSSGYIADSLDIINGSLISNEYVYGNITKPAMRAMADEGIKVSSMGTERFKFDMGDRERVVQAISKGTRFTEGREGVVFRDNSPLDNMMFWKSGTVEDESEPEGDEDRTSKLLSLGEGEKSPQEKTSEEIASSIIELEIEDYAYEGTSPTDEDDILLDLDLGDK